MGNFNVYDLEQCYTGYNSLQNIDGQNKAYTNETRYIST